MVVVAAAAAVTCADNSLIFEGARSLSCFVQSLLSSPQLPASLISAMILIEAILTRLKRRNLD